MQEGQFNQTEVKSYITTFAPADESIPYRIVGTYEYLQAVERLQKLVAESTTEQIDAYNKLLSERPEFAFYNGMATKIPGNPGPLSFESGDQQLEFDKNFKKHGLAWMLALAKIELGSTISMYGTAKKPFAAYAPTQFDMLHFVRLAADDVVVHMKSLAQEDGFKQVVRRSRRPDTWTLAYLRRLKLIKDFQDVLFATGDPEVESRIRPLSDELRKYRKRLVSSIRAVQNKNMDINTETKKTVATLGQVVRRPVGPVRSKAEANQRCQDLANRLGR